MNSACPSCGAVYAVTAKDIGRKIKCKKCSTGLRVDDSGLVVDAPGAAPPPSSRSSPALAAAVVEEDDDVAVPKKGKRDDDEEEVIPKKGKKAGRAYTPGGGGALAGIGGIPTVLFSVGLILVIWFTFMAPIGDAAIIRAATSPVKLQQDMASEMKKKLPAGKKSEFELKGDELTSYQTATTKIREDYAKKLEAAGEEATDSMLGNLRSSYFEKYGQMLGFLFLAFGCVGYLRTEQLPVMHYVAGVILAGMMLAIFSQATGCGGGDDMGRQMRNEIMKGIGGKGKGGGGGFMP